MLGMKDSSGVGARLEKWTSEESLGWVFDNPQDSMTLDARFIGFDMTDFLDNADIRTPVMLYLFHRIDQLLTGERMIICIDEFWKALGDDRSEEHTSELQSLMRISYAVFCLTKKQKYTLNNKH